MVVIDSDLVHTPQNGYCFNDFQRQSFGSGRVAAATSRQRRASYLSTTSLLTPELLRPPGQTACWGSFSHHPPPEQETSATPVHPHLNFYLRSLSCFSLPCTDCVWTESQLHHQFITSLSRHIQCSKQSWLSCSRHGSDVPLIIWEWHIFVGKEFPAFGSAHTWTLTTFVVVWQPCKASLRDDCIC